MTDRERIYCIDFCIHNDEDFLVQPVSGQVKKEDEGYYFYGDTDIKVKLPDPANEEEQRLIKKMMKRPQYIYAASIIMRIGKEYDRCLCFRYLTEPEKEAKSCLEEDIRSVYCNFKNAHSEEGLMDTLEQAMDTLRARSGLRFLKSQILSGDADGVSWKK